MTDGNEKRASGSTEGAGTKDEVADPSVPGAGDAAVPDGAVMARLGCTQCGLSFDLPAGACVVDHPAVVAYYHERGENIRTRPYLALPFTHAAQSDLVSTDPVRVRVDVPTTDPDLRLWLDGETNVVAYERG